MSWTDESGNPECGCEHLWSNHCHRYLWFGCEAPDCDCPGFNEITVADKFTIAIYEMEESEALDYDCERHGKGKGPDCPTCFFSDGKIKGRYIP